MSEARPILPGRACLRVVNPVWSMQERCKDLIPRVVPMVQALPEHRGQKMSDTEQDLTLDRVKRIVALIEVGVPLWAIQAAIDRATDGNDLGQLIGLLEDIKGELRA